MRETPNTTALLIEYGFIDNPRDQRKLQNNIEDYAEGVVKAVSEYIGVPYVQPGAIASGDTYTVQRGDSLYSIAQRYNTTVNELKNLNNLTGNTLAVGQVLRLPKGEEQNEYDTYIVQNGDSLYSIANRFNLNVLDLIDFNGLPSTILTVGETLKIPKGSIDTSEMVYTVKPGDTLYRIASTYGVSIEDLINVNNLTSNILSIGQQITIPIKSVTEEDFVVYKVMPNDTLYSIARRYNTKVDAIKSYNGLTSNILSIGQVIQIPLNSNETQYQTYQVEKGDTLYSIARRYNTTIPEIMAINNDLSSNLNIGQVIKIPQ